MRSILTRAGVVAGLLLFAPLVRAADDGEEKVALKDLPSKVSEAVKKKFPEAKLKSASKEKEEGETLFEVSIENDDVKIDVMVTPGGVIKEYEKEISVKKLPAKVLAAVMEKYPKAKIVKAEELIEIEDGKDETEAFEVAITVGEKKREVVVSPKGKIIDDDEDDDDDDDDDDKGGKKEKKD